MAGRDARRPHAARATADADGSGSGSGADLDASVIEARARDLAARLEGARTPLLASLSDAPASAAAEVGVLSERERAVLEHVIAGEANAAIAGALNVSVRTVERHLSNVFSKTGTANRAAAVAWGLRNHMG